MITEVLRREESDNLFNGALALPVRESLPQRLELVLDFSTQLRSHVFEHFIVFLVKLLTVYAVRLNATGRDRVPRIDNVAFQFGLFWCLWFRKDHEVQHENSDAKHNGRPHWLLVEELHKSSLLLPC